MEKKSLYVENSGEKTLELINCPEISEATCTCLRKIQLTQIKAGVQCSIRIMERKSAQYRKISESMRKNLCEHDKNSRSRTETQAGTITLGGKITEWQKKNEPLETKEIPQQKDGGVRKVFAYPRNNMIDIQSCMICLIVSPTMRVLKLVPIKPPRCLIQRISWKNKKLFDKLSNTIEK